MSIHERRSIVNVIAALVLTPLFSALMLQQYPSGGLAGDAYSPDVFRFWGAFFLLLTLLSIVVRIAVYIGFAIASAIITQREEPTITDERDHLIELRSTRYSLYVFGIGFLLAMGSLVVGLPPAAMFIILVCTGFASTLVNELSQFYFYWRGFHDGQIAHS